MDKEQYEKKIKTLQAKIEKLEKEIKDKFEIEEKLKKGSAEEILDNAGRMFGLSRLIASAEKFPELKERLKKIDIELKGKLSAIPLKRSPDKISFRSGGLRSRKEPSFQRRDVDIFDEESYLLVIYEIPGVDEKSIETALKADKLSVFTDKGGKRIEKEIILPSLPKGVILKNYKNGILEIKIFKDKQKTGKKNADRHQ